MADIDGVKYVMCPIDLLDEAWFKRLRPRFPDLAERVFRLAILGQAMQPSNGRILGSRSTPLEAEDIASRCGAWSEEEAATWQELLAALADVGVIRRHEEGGWEFARRTDWWRLTKETSEYQAVKKAKQRANQAPRGSAISPCPPVSPPCPPPVPQMSPPNTCIHESGKRKEERGIVPPPSPPPVGAGAGAGRENEGDEGEPKVFSECLRLAQALHGQALPAKAERKVRDEVEALLQAGHPPDAIGAWCRQACEDLRRDPNGLNVPVFGISRRMRQLATAPPSETPPAGQAKPPRHRVGCRCPVCGIVDDIVRWGLDVPVPPGGKPSPDDLRSLEQACQASATERFLPGLSPDQVRSGIVEALRLVDDVQPHVRAACSTLAKHLGKNTPGRASPGPRRSATFEPVPANAG